MNKFLCAVLLATGSILSGKSLVYNKIVTARVGDRFDIAVPSVSPGSTGYKTFLKSTSQEGIVEPKTSKFKPSSRAIGAPGEMVFTFRAVSAGDVQLVFGSKQPWEGGNESKKTFTALVRVIG